MPDPPDESSFRRRGGAAALLVIVLAVYLPVMRSGGFIWDDPQYVTANPTLRDLGGLAAIWIHPTSIPQYYPLVHTTFWIEYHLWGLRPRGYHIDNVLLHAAAAILLWRFLRRLGIPGSLLAAAFFAVHPVNVESVAWITERKNVLSAVFYFLSAHAYLRFASNNLRSNRFVAGAYVLSLAFFVAALLSKSVTCSLPAAILLLILWRHGNLRWRDVLPPLPFFAAGLAMAATTAILETRHVGAAGREWNWTFADRCLIAGRALWFYAFKLLWPARLSFIYPMWTRMHLAQRPGLIAFPASAAGVLAALWLLRRRLGRGPLVAVLFFFGTLLPALGFINIYPMRYSLVADHFQYLAAIGLFVLAAAILHRRLLTRAVAWAALVLLAILTVQQQVIYKNAIDLWQDTLAKNPHSFMVWGNLGDQYADLSNDQNLAPAQRAFYRSQARNCYTKLIELAPDQPIAHYKWGIVKEYDGDLEAARAEFAKALEIEPQFAPAMDSMGVVLMQLHRPDEAMQFYRRAIAIDPRFAELRFHYGIALEGAGEFDQAIDQYVAATLLKPNYAEAEFNLANLLVVQKHRSDLALRYYADAVAQHPGRADYHAYFAIALYKTEHFDEARTQCRAALQLDPNLAPAKNLWKLLGPP
ncbi:MAG: tetratricopeptide repeat protein [Tepidisphaeraceae bacterium]|jgi:tetratricopeptide (TPR) repeat protein